MEWLQQEILLSPYPISRPTSYSVYLCHVSNGLFREELNIHSKRELALSFEHTIKIKWRAVD